MKINYAISGLEGSTVSRLLFPCLLLALAMACAPRARIPLPPDQLRLHEEILDRIAQRREKIETLSAVGRIVLITPRERFAADELVRLRPPDALRLETRDALGGLQMLLVSRDGQGMAWIPGESRGYRFSADDKALKRSLGIELSVSELIPLLTGTPPLPPAAPDALRSERVDGQIVLHLPDGRREQRVWVDGAGQVSRWERVGPGGRIEIRVDFSDYREEKGIAVPMAISYEGPDETTLTVRYRSMHLNEPQEERFFDPPDLDPPDRQPGEAL